MAPILSIYIYIIYIIISSTLFAHLNQIMQEELSLDSITRNMYDYDKLVWYK